MNYAIIKENYPYLAQETVLTQNKYNAKKKYAIILKSCHKDGSESITAIFYSDNLQLLSEQAKEYPSWYNYPLGVCKNMQGYLSEI